MAATLMDIGRAADEGQMRGFGRALAPLLEPGDVVVLSGDLGAGKTHLAQGVAAGLGVAEAVTSPTFNVLSSYGSGRLPLNHFDLYRLQEASQLEDIDFYAAAGPESDGVALVEWGERFAVELPEEYLEAQLLIAEDGAHEVRARAVGERPAALLEAWAAAVRGDGAASAGERRSVDAPEEIGAEGEHEEAPGQFQQELRKGGLEQAPADARYVLAFDTANEVVAIALGVLDAPGQRIEPVAMVEEAAHRASNTRLLPLVDELVRRVGAQRSQIACVSVGLGPGSFTGVRIAMATAKGIASALGVGLVGVSTLDAVAWNAWAQGVRGDLLVLADAMRQEVYPARYRLGTDGPMRLTPDRVIKAQVAADEYAGATLQLIGDGLAKHEGLLRACGSVLPPALWAPTGRGLLLALQAAWHRGDADSLDAQRHDPAFALPVYTRLSDAEENERVRLASSAPKNLRTGVQDAPAPDGGVGRRTLHSAATLKAVSRGGVAYAPLDGAHVGAVAALEAEAMGTDAWSAALVADELSRKDRTWWMALVDGDLAGYGGAWVADGEMQLLKVAVAPGFRRQGIARALIGQLADDARNLGATRASLEVRASNQAARALYEALGFEDAGVRPGYYSDREDAAILAAPLEELSRQVPQGFVAGMEVQRHGAPVLDADALTPPVILAIESSCDETAAALVDGSGRLLSDVVASQVDFHGRFGGVVPEIASRKHIEAICGVCDEAFDAAASALGRPAGGLGWGDVQAVAATYAPGLVGALVVGVAFAKGAAWALDVPYVGVNHLEGHLYANLLAEGGFIPPAVVSLVSGGNTMLVHMRGWGDYRVLGQTIDDAVGEAFDKVAKALGLGYPGGPAISALAAQGDPGAIAFPRAMLHSGDLRFSLSGLKTAVVNHIDRERRAGRPLNLPDLCASFQAAVIDVQVSKAARALEQTGVPTFCLGGGVAANPALREAYERMCAERGVRLVMPPLTSCGDNAGMIALVALDRFRQGRTSPLSSDAFAHADLEEPY